ncbi:MAG: hypothetical protein JO358_12285 [Alphaproteobacteria bacterium]|nr:hypothetical protein [Alphaproteobacteria bacterium]
MDGDLRPPASHIRGGPGEVNRLLAKRGRFAGAQVDKMEEVVKSLLPQIDLLVVWGNTGMPAKKLAGGVPTVFISIGFPVELGLVQSLAHPDGNMTDIAAEAALEINERRLQILKEIVPGLARVAVLRDSADQSNSFLWDRILNGGC